MQWRLLTAGVALGGVCTAGLVYEHVLDRPAAAEAPVLSGPASTPSTTAAPPTSPRAASTGAPAPTSSSTAPPTTTTTTRRILPSYAPAVPGQLARAIANRNTAVCDLFTPHAAQQLAAATGTPSCPAAIEALAAKVTNAASYANPSGAGQAQPAGDRRVTVDACHLTWTEWGGSGRPPGPQIGHLTLDQPAGSVGYLIAGYRPC